MTETTLFSALMGVHAEVETLSKDGWNDQGGYSFAKGDTVVRESRKLLAKHGILWVRTSARLTAPTLGLGSIGDRMTYVGNVEISGQIVHASTSGFLPIVAEAPIVVMGARPHDKAWAASITFGTGYLLLGVLNQDKASEAEINNRKDEQEPLCVGQAAPIAASNKARCEELAAVDGADKHAVWAYVCGECDVPRDELGYPPPAKLFVSEGKRVGDLLKKLLAAKGPPPGGEPDQDPNNGAEAYQDDPPGAP